MILRDIQGYAIHFADSKDFVAAYKSGKTNPVEVTD